MFTSSNDATAKADTLKYISKARLLIHADQTIPQLTQMLKGSDPVQRVADASVMIAQRVDAASRTSGHEVNDGLKVAAGMEIVNDISDVLEASLGTVLNKDLRYLAFSVTIQDYVKAEVKARRMNAQQLRVSMQQGIRQMPAKTQKEVKMAPAKIQAIARKYNHGKGLASFPPDPKQVKAEK